MHAVALTEPMGWETEMTVALTKDEQFFYDHAGWSYDPKTETEEGGRRRCATEAARDERWANDNGVQFVWEWDDFPWDSDITNEDGTPYVPETVECCAAMLDGESYASLCGIADATREYRRVIEAELASEARGGIEKAKAHAAMIAPVLDDLKAARNKLGAVIGGTLPEGSSTRPRLPYVLALKEAHDALQRARMHLGGVTLISN